MATTKLIRLRKKREELRNHIKGLWKKGKTFDEADMKIVRKLNALHADILKKEMNDAFIDQVRVGYSVCGYSEKHGYFRSKRFISENEKESQAEFEKAKKDPDWGIPTLLILEIFLRKESPAMVDFDNAPIDQLSFSNEQAIIDKHMCGNKKFRWKYLIDIQPEGHRFTY